MERPEKLTSIDNRLNDDHTGSFVGEVSTLGGTDDDDRKIAAEIARRWNACSGIPTAALTPRLVGEMAVALRLACARLEAAGGVVPANAPDILARIGKDTQP